MMHNARFLPAVLGTALLAACASTPTTTPTLTEARAAYSAASADPRVASSAPLEFRQATEALNQANAAAADNASLDRIDQLAYVAKQKVATAQETARARQAEQDIANARQQRTEVQLQARTAEADRAQRDAASAQAQAEQARLQAEQARLQAEQAQQQNTALSQRAAQLEALLVELHATKTERGYVVTLGDVLFATDRADLTPAGVATLRKLGDLMTQNPERTVLVEGFTDSTGSSAHNQQLSERRASAVAAALNGMGVPRERIAMRAYGEAYPVAPNSSAANRQLNRRVEIVLSDPNAPIPPRAAAR